VSENWLKRESAIPLYFQLQELLKGQIEAGTWRVGELIPSEPDLCETYDVSRTVVRQALSVLEQDGQLLRVRGRGTFVAVPKIEQRVGGVSRLMSSAIPGHQLSVLDLREELPPDRIRKQLSLRQGTRILRAMTLLRVDQAPVALFDSFFPMTAAADLRRRIHEKPPFTLTPDFKKPTVKLGRTTVAIETSFCSAWEAEQLQIPVQGAVFVTLCTDFRQGPGKAVPQEVVRGVYRADRIQLRFDLANKGDMPTALWQIADGSGASTPKRAR